MFLTVDTLGRLILCCCDKKLKQNIYVDFTRGPVAHRRFFGGGKRQLLVKAVGRHEMQGSLSVLDATAGFGQDAFILASLGCPRYVIRGRSAYGRAS